MWDGDEEDDCRLHPIGTLPAVQKGRRRVHRLPASVPAVHGIGNLAAILPVEEVTDAHGRVHKVRMSHLPTPISSRRSDDLHVIDRKTGAVVGAPDRPRPFDEYTFHRLTGDHNYMRTPDEARRTGVQPRNEHARLTAMNPGEDVFRELGIMRDQEALETDVANLEQVMDAERTARLMPETEAWTMQRMAQQTLNQEDPSGAAELSSIARTMDDMDRSHRDATGGALSSKLLTSGGLGLGRGAWGRGDLESDGMDQSDVDGRGTESYYSERDERQSVASGMAHRQTADSVVSTRAQGGERINSSAALAEGKRNVSAGDASHAAPPALPALEAFARLIKTLSSKELRAAVSSGSGGGGSRAVDHHIQTLIRRASARDRALVSSRTSTSMGEVQIEPSTRKLVRALARKELAVRAAAVQQHAEVVRVDQDQSAQISSRRQAHTETYEPADGSRGRGRGAEIASFVTLLLPPRHDSTKRSAEVVGARGQGFAPDVDAGAQTLSSRVDALRDQAVTTAHELEFRVDVGTPQSSAARPDSLRPAWHDPVGDSVREQQHGGGLDLPLGASRPAREQAAGRVAAASKVANSGAVVPASATSSMLLPQRLTKAQAATEIWTKAGYADVVQGGVDALGGVDEQHSGALNTGRRTVRKDDALHAARSHQDDTRVRVDGAAQHASVAQRSERDQEWSRRLGVNAEGQNDFDQWADQVHVGAGAGVRPERDLSGTVGEGVLGHRSAMGVPGEDEAAYDAGHDAGADGREWTGAAQARASERQRHQFERAARFNRESLADSFGPVTRGAEEIAAQRVNRDQRPGQRRHVVDMSSSMALAGEKVRSGVRAASLVMHEDRVRERGARRAIYESSDEDSSGVED